MNLLMLHHIIKLRICDGTGREGRIETRETTQRVLLQFYALCGGRSTRSHCDSFFMATNPTALWSRAPFEGNQIYPILELQTPTLSRLLYPVREGTFLIGREDWASEGRVSQKKWTLGDDRTKI